MHFNYLFVEIYIYIVSCVINSALLPQMVLLLIG